MQTLQEKNTLGSQDTIEQFASMVKRLGNPVSTILLDSKSNLFNIPHLDGVIGYQLHGNCAVVIGDPICLPENSGRLTHAFHQFCQQSNWNIVYFLASEPFAHEAINNGCQTLIQVGEEFILDPTHFQKNQKIRWKINHSLNRGVVIKEYLNVDPILENQMNDTIQAWLKGKKGPQIYLGKLNLTEGGKRIFYASQNNKIVGLLALSKIDRFQGWVVNMFLAVDDHIGISEHLMTTVFDTLSAENCHFLCLGAVSGTKLGEMVGLNKFSKFIARCIFRISRWYFHLDARKTYLNKYHPHSRPTYILSSGKLSIRELLSIKKALNVKLFN